MEKANGKRALSTSPEKAPPKKKQALNHLPKGLTEVHNPGAGDCLFHSLSQSLEKAGGGHKTPLQCRAQCVAHLTKYRDAYERHWDGCRPKKGNDVTNDRNFAKYLEEIAQASAWGSALEGTAFAMTHDRPVYVFCPGQEQKNFLFNRNGKRKPLFLKYDAASEHYTCLVPDQTFQCPEDVIDGPHCGLRGAAISNGSRPKPGKSPSSTGTRKSVQLRLKKAVSSSDNKFKQSERGACSIGTRPSVQKRLQKHNVPKGNRTFTTNFLDQVRSLSEEACPACPEISAENANSSQGDTDNFTWHCAICQRTLRAKRLALLSKKRNGHIRNVHPDKPKSAFHTIRSQYESVPTRSLADLPQRRWVCEYCDEGLPWLPEPQKRLSIKCHLQQRAFAPRNATRNSNARKRKRSAAGWMGGDFLQKCKDECEQYAKATGHSLTYFPADKGRYATVVCCTCTRFWNSLADVKRYACKIANNNGNQCPGSQGRFQQLRRKSAIQLWSKFPTWRQRLANAWCLTSTERQSLNSQPNDFQKVARENGHKVVAIPNFRKVAG